MNMENNTPGKTRLIILYACAFCIVLLDRATKVLSDANLEPGVPFQVFPGFDLMLAYNTGAAFSFLSEAGGWQRWLLTAVSLGVSIFLAVWLAKLRRSQRLLSIALVLLLGGAVGNLYDRALAGYVIDFISVYAGDWRFATFNIADSAISAGTSLMVLDIILDWRKTPEMENGKDSAP